MIFLFISSLLFSFAAYPQAAICCGALQAISEQCYSACLSVSVNARLHAMCSLSNYPRLPGYAIRGLQRSNVRCLRWCHCEVKTLCVNY